ncbi:MAG TPA: DASS family sodium-coupled anion symporter [Bacillota bacterium]
MGKSLQAAKALRHLRRAPWPWPAVLGTGAQFLAVAAVLGAWLAPPPVGLTPAAARALALLLAALTFWSLGSVPAGLTSAALLLAIPLLGILEFDEAVASLGQPFIWLLLATFIMARAVDQVRLGKRIALGLLGLTGGRSAYCLLAVLVAPLLLCFILPTSSGRAALMAPICDAVVRTIRSAPGGDAAGGYRRLARAMFVGLAFTSVISGVVVMTGSSAAVYAAGVFQELTGERLDYVRWLLAFLPLGIVFVALLWIGLLLLEPPETRLLAGGSEHIRRAHKELGRPSAAELRVLAWVSCVVLGWVTEPYHGLSVPMVALLGAVGLTLPRLGVLTWNEAVGSMSWDIAIQFAAGFTLAMALNRSGAATWLAGALARLYEQPGPLGAALFVLAIMAVARTAFVNTISVMATMLPIVVQFAATWHMNPGWLALFAIVGTTFSFFFLSQAPTNGITYMYGHYTTKDLMKAGLVALLLMMAIAVVLGMVWWPAIGFKP